MDEMGIHRIPSGSTGIRAVRLSGRQRVRRRREAAQLRAGRALRFLQKKTLLPAETRGAGLSGFRGGLQRLRGSDLRGDWPNPREAFDQGRVNFVRSRGWSRRFAGLFRFRFCHFVVGENISPNIRSPPLVWLFQILSVTLPVSYVCSCLNLRGLRAGRDPAIGGLIVD